MFGLDWLDEIIGGVADIGLPDVADVFGDAAGGFNPAEMVFDTFTGEWVDLASLDPSLVTDLDLSGSGAGAVGDILGPAVDDPSQFFDLDLSGSGSGAIGPDPFSGSLDASPVSRSTSDFLRSLEGGGGTTPGSEPFDWSAMADPSASIASAGGGTDWARALAKGLGMLGSGLSKGLGGLGAGSGASGLAGGGGGLGLMSAPSADVAGSPAGGLMSLATSGAGTPEVRAGMGLGGLGQADTSGVSLPGRMADPSGATSGRVDTPSGLAALLSRLQADAQRVGLQGPIDAGREPVRFQPLTIPMQNPQAPQMPPAPRLSGLQALLAQRRG